MDSEITEKPEPKQITSNEDARPLSPRSYKDAVLTSISTPVETESKVVDEHVMGIPVLNNEESDSESESESSDDEESSDGEESSDSDSDSDSSDSSSSDDESAGDTLDIENTDEVPMVENVSTNPFDDGEEDLLTMPLLHSPPIIHSEIRHDVELKQDDFAVFERKEEEEVAEEVLVKRTLQLGKIHQLLHRNQYWNHLLNLLGLQ